MPRRAPEATRTHAPTAGSRTTARGCCGLTVTVFDPDLDPTGAYTALLVALLGRALSPERPRGFGRRGLRLAPPAEVRATAHRTVLPAAPRSPAMAPLVVQLVAWAALYAAGRLGVLAAAGTPVGALRLALAAMFVFTALSHVLPATRPALVRMVPAALPAPGTLVTLTGGLELAGAAGLLVPGLARPAALALAALLVVLFPANVHADRAAVEIAGRRATPLRLRLPLQLFWVACLLWVAAAGRAR